MKYITIKEIKEKLESEDYNFLRTDERLRDNIVLLAVGGSISYGTNTPDSDIDIRGIAIPNKDTLLSIENGFDQITDTKTDTVIYNLSKIIKLFIGCSPNTLEILGYEPDLYLYKNWIGDLILENKDSFLSKKAVKTFREYGKSQLRIVEDMMLKQKDISKLEKHYTLDEIIINRVNEINDKYKGTNILRIDILSDNEYFEKLQRELSIKKQDVLNQLHKDTKSLIYKNINLLDKETNIPYLVRESNLKIKEIEEDISDKFVRRTLKDKISIKTDLSRLSLDNINSVIQDINKITNIRNKRIDKETKDLRHMNKAMMHIIRAYKMGIILNSTGKIVTKLNYADNKMLINIREGYYTNNKSKIINSSFYDLVDELTKEYEHSCNNTVLKDSHNKEAIASMLDKIYRETYFRGLEV